jgi:hypothetical protein
VALSLLNITASPPVHYRDYVTFSDNYITLLPGERRSVYVTLPRAAFLSMHSDVEIVPLPSL